VAGAGAGGEGGEGGMGGTGGTAPVVPGYCEPDGGGVVNALPLNVADHFTTLLSIGPGGSEDDFAVITNPDCDELFTGGGAASDAGDAGNAGDAGDAGDGGMSGADASVVDAGGTTDAGAAGDAGDAGPGGECYGFHYTPTGGWAGAIFQTNDMPQMQGPTGEGVCIEEGAVTISFEARADRVLPPDAQAGADTTAIKFGSIREGFNQTEFWTPITTSWDTYTVSIPANEPYNDTATPGGVWNLFSVVTVASGSGEAPTVGEVKVFVRNIVWEAP
jgi:hypothetical protein